MKICAYIAEYNPLHLGHIKHINYIKNVLKADKIIAIMGGNFTQRGESAIMNKFVRAKHAILSGVDMVIELPTIFACSNAETFCKGGIDIINSLGVVDTICFGVESGTINDYIKVADFLNDESKQFKALLKENLDNGFSFAKAKSQAIQNILGEKASELLEKPNNILGIEYIRALRKLNSDISVELLVRDGDHNDKKISGKITSASSIREAIKKGKKTTIKKYVPKYVYKDIFLINNESFEKVVLASLITSNEKKLASVLDCTEGLENRLKSLVKDNLSLNELIENASTKRYTKTRISRILTSNLLGIETDIIKAGLSKGSYAKILAVKNDSKQLVSQISLSSKIPILTRKSDIEKLNKTQSKIFEIDVLANDIYNIITGEKTNEYQMLII